MPKQDDTLQISLEALEAGEPLDSVLADLPEESGYLHSLIQLASEIKTHSIPEPQFSETLVQDVCQSIRAEQPQSAFEVPHWVKTLNANWREFFRRSLSTSTGRLVGAALVAVLLVVAVFSFSFWFGNDPNTPEVKLIDVAGVVEITSGRFASNWREVSDPQSIKEGQRIRTGADGSATILFYDGSRVVLEPNTDLKLVAAGGDGQNSLNVSLYQYSGNTDHSVVPFTSEESAYRVDTPMGSANVHGTTFQVLIPKEDVARFSVDTGLVLVEGIDNDIFLNAGQATIAQAGKALPSPAYQFSLEGILGEDKLGRWIVEGVPFKVLPETILQGDPGVGDFIHVNGRVLEDSTWIADIVEVTHGSQPKAAFTGIVQSKGSEWTISKTVVIVDADSKMDPGLAIGDPVKVQFVVLEDGRWKAISGISLLENPLVPSAIQEENPVTDPATTPQVVTLPTLTGSPSPTLPETDDTPTLVPENNDMLDASATPDDDNDQGIVGDDQGDDDNDQGDDDNDQGDDDNDQGDDGDDQGDDDQGDDGGDDDDQGDDDDDQGDDDDDQGDDDDDQGDDGGDDDDQGDDGDDDDDQGDDGGDDDDQGGDDGGDDDDQGGDDGGDDDQGDDGDDDDQGDDGNNQGDEDGN